MDTLGYRRGRAPGTAGRATWVKWAGTAAVYVGALSGLAGCSLSPHSTLSASSLEAKISSELARAYKVSPPEVSCPASVRAAEGTHFTCTATLAGQPLRVIGTVTDDKGRVEVRAGSAVVVKSAAEAEIGQSLSRKVGRPVPVSCAVPQLLVADPGLGFGCTAEVAGVERQLTVMVVNLAGGLRYRVLPYHATRAG
jgi:Domain of unknown function (DUF4333)